MKTQDLAPENLLASISENVKQGLNIMDEKYKMMDVACSDSEDDDGGAIVVRLVVIYIVAIKFDPTEICIKI